MIESKVKGIILTGIKKYANKYGVSPEKEMQILITDEAPGTETEPLTYKIAVNWETKETISFLDIMDKPIDFFGFSMLATQFIRLAIANIANENKCLVEDIFVFMYLLEGKIVIAVYKLQDGNPVNIRQMSLEKFLSEAGIG